MPRDAHQFAENPAALGPKNRRPFRPVDDCMASVRSLPHQLPGPLQHFPCSAPVVQRPGTWPRKQRPLALRLLLDLRPDANPRRLGRGPGQPALALLCGVCPLVSGPGLDRFRHQPGRPDHVPPSARYRGVHLPPGRHQDREHLIHVHRTRTPLRPIRFRHAHGPGDGWPHYSLVAASTWVGARPSA